jgi:hypothetical protein
MKLGGLARASGGRSIGRAGRSVSDVAIGAGGVLLAASAVGVAVVQIASNDGAPKINGAEHFGLFARPMAYHEEKVRSRGEGLQPVGVSTSPPPTNTVDYEATATIAKPIVESGKQTEGVGRFVDGKADRLRVRHVRRDHVALESNGRILVLRVGDRTPDGRRVVAIVKRAGQWTAVFRDERGAQTSR